MTTPLPRAPFPNGICASLYRSMSTCCTPDTRSPARSRDTARSAYSSSAHASIPNPSRTSDGRAMHQTDKRAASKKGGNGSAETLWKNLLATFDQGADTYMKYFLCFISACSSSLVVQSGQSSSIPKPPEEGRSLDRSTSCAQTEQSPKQRGV